MSRQTTQTNLNRGGPSGRLEPRRPSFQQSEEIKGEDIQEEEIPEFPEMEDSSYRPDVISQFINSPDFSKIKVQEDEQSFAQHVEMIEPPLESETGSEVVEQFISKTFLSEKDQEMLNYIERELKRG